MKAQGTMETLTSLKDEIQTQSPFCRPATWNPFANCRIPFKACLEEIERVGLSASIKIYITVEIVVGIWVLGNWYLQVDPLRDLGG